jgi:hypothetical protein
MHTMSLERLAPVYAIAFMALICVLYIDDGVEAFGFEGYEIGQSTMPYHTAEIIKDRCSG